MPHPASYNYTPNPGMFIELSLLSFKPTGQRVQTDSNRRPTTHYHRGFGHKEVTLIVMLQGN